jgi:hypothetical protein
MSTGGEKLSRVYSLVLIPAFQLVASCVLTFTPFTSKRPDSFKSLCKMKPILIDELYGVGQSRRSLDKAELVLRVTLSTREENGLRN